MSFNKDKFTMMEDIISLPTNSDIEPSPKTGQTNFENFGHLSMDLLRFLCYELGILETGMKQNLVNCLISKTKKRSDFVGSNNLGKEKEYKSEKNSKEALNNSNKFNFEIF
ncbi:41169_t:CDS:1 [Gigaspora margarita]|uniref:41169_t:CDS:1 n=1 Tax=Gigaspora margarita TaxID=4874 RepID=A0ABN7V7H8_GIGMA|nr:41169_t:CDS:1 [Gigaspora margarita]